MEMNQLKPTREKKRMFNRQNKRPKNPETKRYNKTSDRCRRDSLSRQVMTYNNKRKMDM